VPVGRNGCRFGVTAFAWDGFDGTINVTVEKSPAGVDARGRRHRSWPRFHNLVAERRRKDGASIRCSIKSGGRAQRFAHVAIPEDTLEADALMPKADVRMTDQLKV